MIKGILTPAQVCAEMVEGEITQAEVRKEAQIAHSTFTRWRMGKTSISLERYKSIMCIIERAKAQAARRRRRLRHQQARYGLSLAVGGGTSQASLPAAGASSRDT